MVESYVKFSKYYKAFLYAQAEQNKDVLNDEKRKPFYQNIMDGVMKSHLFSITEETKKLLMLTNPPNKNDPMKLPYDYCFLDVSFTKDEAKQFGHDIEGDIIGIILTTAQFQEENTGNLVNGSALRITICVWKDDRITFNTVTTNIDLSKEFKNYKISTTYPDYTSGSDKLKNKTKNFVQTFVVNFLNLLNDPEIETILHAEDKEKNIKREKRGKIPLPSTTIIRLDGKRKQYVNSLVSGNHFHYSYSFFVRGHWKTLKSNRYKENKGKKLWILPYIKNLGKGILIEKSYEVKV